MRNTKLEAPAQMSIGDTKVTITGGTLVYAIGGSKASTSGELTVENGNVQMAIGGETKITGKVIGGNYIKNSAATSSGAGAGKGGWRGARHPAGRARLGRALLSRFWLADV